MSLLFRASARYLSQHRAQCLLAVSGIALGVAIVMGIQITQHSARVAFERSLRGVFGDATHRITDIDGALNEVHLAGVRRIAPHWRPAPVVSGLVRHHAGDDVHVLRVVGIDPLSVSSSGFSTAFDVSRLLRVPGAALISDRTAAQLGVRTGDGVAIKHRQRDARLEIIGVLGRNTDPSRTIADDFVIVDIATAQELLGMAGRLSRIELNADGERGTATLSALRAALPSTVTISDSGRNVASAREMTRAFYTNLDALSLLALLVGGFMIYNTIAFLVAQRQTLFARLRALGVSRSQIAKQIATEAVLLGSVGGCFGNLLGYALAGALMQPMSQTLSDHYHGNGPAVLDVNPLLFVGGLVLAIACSLAAAIVPALHAAAIPPTQLGRTSDQESHAATVLIWCERAGAAFALMAVALLALPTHALAAGFAVLGCALLAATLATPRIAQRLLASTNRFRGRRLPLPERLALKGASRSMGRIGMAIATLMAATATSIGIGLMVASFRTSVSDWLGQLLRAEFYISQDVEQRAAPAIRPDVVQRLRSDARVAALSKVRRAYVRHGDREIRLTAYDLPAPARAGFRFIAGDAENIWHQWDSGDTVIVSEPFAWHNDIAIGDEYRVPTPAGPRQMTVTGIYTDYGNERGVVAMSWSTFVRYWGETPAHGLGVYPQAGVDLDGLRADLTRIIGARGDLALWSNAEIRQRSLAVFDRTFSVTDVLTLFAALIAALGVFNALLALHLERRREYAMLRATGCGSAFIRRCIYAQTLIVAGLTVVLAIPLGILIAVLLIEIINVRSFGWSMTFDWHAASIVMPCVFAISAAVAASVYPAERIVRGDPAAALRYE